MSLLQKACIACLVYVAFLLATEQPTFVRYTNESGLSQATVFAITQDALGFLWVGTMDGLNRFDGNRFIHFRKIPFDSTSLPDHIIRSLLATEDSLLWIGTNSAGVVCLDLNTGTFSQIPDSGTQVHRVTALVRQPGTQKIVAGSDAGLFYTERDNPRLVKLGNRSFDVSAFGFLDEHTILAATVRNGLWVVDLSSGRWERKIGLPTELQRVRLTSLLIESGGTVWLGTAGRGLFRSLDKGAHWAQVDLHSHAREATIKDRTISVIYRNSEGDIFVGTRRGLFILDTTEKYPIHVVGTPENSVTLSDNSVISVFEDRGGIMWLGTWSGGLNRMIQPLGYFNPENRSPQLEHNIVLAACEDSLGHVWIGTNGQALYDVELNSGRVRQYTPRNTRHGLTDYTVQCVVPGKNGRIWLGTLTGGLFVFDYLKKSWKQFTHQAGTPHSLSSNNVHVLARMGDSLLVGTSHGLDVVHLAGGRIERLNIFAASLNTSPEIISLRPHSDGSVWIGTYNKGLFHWQPRAHQLDHYCYDESNPHGLSSNTIWDVLPVDKRTVYIATAQGLNRLNLETGRVESYFESDGLPNETIYRLELDSLRRLWASTNNGLVLIEKPLEAHPPMFAFSSTEGLVSNEFNMGASWRLRDGRLVFGTINGLQWVNPDYVSSQAVVPHINIVQLDLPRSGQRPLWGFLNNSRWPLKYPDNTFTFQVAVSDYGNPGANRISVFLEGEDLRWSVPSPRRYYTYSNLNPGHYVLHVRASCGLGTGAASKSIVIDILPAWWQTIWFRLLAGFSVLAFLLFLMWYRIQFYKRLNHFRQRVASDLHDDVGSYLTQIRMTADLMHQTSRSREVKGRMEKIIQLAGNGLHAMRTIIWTLDSRYDKLSELEQKIREMAFSIFEETSIVYSFEIAPVGGDPTCSPLFRRNLLTIVREAFTNILKHSDASRVTLQLRPAGKNLILKICDNGTASEAWEPEEGTGFRNFRKRSEECGGVFHFYRENGYCLFFKFPKKRIFVYGYRFHH